jgi:tetratricopeptide (TPR) repeat protein
MKPRGRSARILGFYHQYLVDQESSAFSAAVGERYTVGTLERLAYAGDRMTRRAAVLALGLLADYGSNAAVGRALLDDDRGVRLLAENAIRHLWCRVGTQEQRLLLADVIELNLEQKFHEAVAEATRLIDRAPWLSEAWNQRALALFSVGRFAESIHDCHQALEINPYHFGAAAGMGQCHLQLSNSVSALECFRRALKLNPNLEGVRAHVQHLQRSLESQE